MLRSVTTQTEWAASQCELAGCDVIYRVRRGVRPPRFCPDHRRRPWHELRIHRAATGLTMAELARRSGVRDIYLYQLLSGDRHPSQRHIALVAAALGVNATDVTPHADTVVPAELLGDEPIAEATG